MSLRKAATAIGARRSSWDVARFRVDPARARSSGRAVRRPSGERFAGTIIGAAKARGATASGSSRTRCLSGKSPLLVWKARVSRSGRLAAHWRGRFDYSPVRSRLPTAKPRSRRMIAGDPARAFGRVAHARERGEPRNDIGLPLTLQELRGDHHAARGGVWE